MNILLAASFRSIDLLVIAIYLAAMAAMGVYFSKKNDSTEQYFLGSRSFPGWAIGLSMVGTSISSMTFLAFPAAAYTLDWRQVVPNLMLPLVAVVAILVFIPLFRRGRTTSAFEYLEERFGPLVRLYGAASFLLLQVVRLGTILYLVSLPVAALLGVSIYWCLIVGGLFILFYTVLGGIEAVIWTDVVQTVVLLGGGLLCLADILYELPGGFGHVIEVGREAEKFGVGDFEFDLGGRTVVTMVMVGIFSWVNEYSSNQNVVQRYLSASSTREARKATAICAVMSVPTWVLFFFIGTALWVYYQTVPDAAVAGLEADQVFPHFIVTQIPVGLAGLIIASVLAAAMSSLDSSINAVSTVTVVDVLKRVVAPGRSDRFYLNWAKAIAVAAGLLMIGGGIVFHNIEKESMVDLALIISAVFGGCLCGMFLLGFFTTRVGYAAVLWATLVATLANVYFVLNLLGWLPAGWGVEVHSYWVGLLVNVVFVVVAYAVSWVWPAESRDLDRLTVWTMRVE